MFLFCSSVSSEEITPLTYHGENRQGTGDRPATETEITPEMIAAGEDIYIRCIDEFEIGAISPAQVVSRIYQRMTEARRERLQSQA